MNRDRRSVVGGSEMRIVRVLIAFSLVALLLGSACIEKEVETDDPRGEVPAIDLPDPEPEEPVVETVTETPDETETIVVDDPGIMTETGDVVPIDLPTEDDQIQFAMELLNDGDTYNALLIFEDVYEAGSEREDMPRFLVMAHTQYSREVSMTRGVDPARLNEVWYMHLMRILALEPENPEALAGVKAVMIFYESRGMTLPEEIDPVAFLDVPAVVPPGGDG